MLALFHTAFNILGVVVMWPLTRHLVRFLKGRFRSSEEEMSRPRYLDRNVVATPALAMEALFLELGRIGEISRRMARRALGVSKQGPKGQEGDQQALNNLVDAVGEFAGQMRQNSMPEAVSNLLPNTLRVSRYYSEAAELAQNVTAIRARAGGITTPEFIDAIRAFEVQVVGLVDWADSRMPGYSDTVYQELIQQIKDEYQVLKARLLKAGAEGRLQVRLLVDELDRLSNVRQIGEQIEKGPDTSPRSPAPPPPA
ncbi:MAG: hypothetical protein ACLFUL_08935 [Desulfobacteraceae bacterium]